MSFSLIPRMDYCLPHAVLALLQEENSPQTPKSYFVRSGTHSTKITLVYTRRKRRDKTADPLSLTSFSPFSSNSSSSTQPSATVFEEASTIEASTGLLRFHSSSGIKKVQPLHRSNSLIEGCRGSPYQLKSSTYQNDKRSSTSLSHGGKIVRSSFISSRSQLGSTGTGNGGSSSSSTDDYSCRESHRQQRQQQMHTLTHMDIANHRQNDRKKKNSDWQHSNNNGDNGSADQPTGIENSKGNEETGPSQTTNLSEYPGRQWKTPPADNDAGLLNACGKRRARSDSNNSRRTCVSTPGRGYGDSARVRGAEDPRTRGYSRAVANTDPRRNSVSPRGGVDLCENFRTFDHSMDDLHDHHEHLTISHNSTPRSEQAFLDNHHHNQVLQQQQEDHHLSDKSPHGNSIKTNEPENNHIPWLTRSPNCSKEGSANQGSAHVISKVDNSNENQTCRLENTHSPRPPTPNMNLAVPSPAPCYSPAPCHSPSRQSTFEYDDNDAVTGNFSPPPTPCVRVCAASEDPVESFNSNVKLRLGAHIDQLHGRSPRSTTPKPRRPAVVHTPPPPAFGLHPPSPVPASYANDTHRSSIERTNATHYYRSSK